MFRFAFTAFVGLALFADTPASLGVFEDQSDVGDVLHAGSATYDSDTKTYTVSGSGENMWAAKDEFHFVWKKISSDDVTLTANVSILTQAPEGHRKAVLMIRQSLDNDSPYVDAARHADGLTSLQFREQKGAITREVESNVSGPSKLRLEKQGDHFYLWVAAENENLQFAGGAARVQIHAPYYVGIGACAHQKDAVVKAAFSDVTLETRVNHPAASYSTIETAVRSGDARTAYISRERLGAPGWSSDGRTLTFEVNGQKQEAPFTPYRGATPVGPAASALAENKLVYFASNQSGSMQIWRKPADGGEPEQMTSDDFNNDSPHLSPDGTLLLFLSYSKDLKSLPTNRDVTLRVMSLADKTIRTLTNFTGGQGSLGEQPWSPDGRRVTFISYQLMD